jgi:hypothetical protein
MRAVSLEIALQKEAKLHRGALKGVLITPLINNTKQPPAKAGGFE